MATHSPKANAARLNGSPLWNYLGASWKSLGRFSPLKRLPNLADVVFGALWELLFWDVGLSAHDSEFWALSMRLKSG